MKRDHFVGLFQGQRTKHDGVHESEDRRVATYRERQKGARAEKEERLAPKPPHGNRDVTDDMSHSQTYPERDVLINVIVFHVYHEVLSLL